MGTMVLTPRVELRDPNKKPHTGCLAISGWGRWAVVPVVVTVSPQELLPCTSVLLAAEHSSLSTWGRVNIRPPGGLTWRPPLQLPTTEPPKCFLGSNPNEIAGTSLDPLQPLLRVVLSSSPF